MPDLTVEDGSGKPNANSYVSREDADAYFDTQLRATSWTGATADDRQRALIMATTLIDAYVTESLGGFKGAPASDTQALLFPRAWLPKPDYPSIKSIDGLLPTSSLEAFFPSDQIPAWLEEITAELGKALLAGDLLADDSSRGIKSVTADTVAVVFDSPGKVKRTIPENVLRRLAPYVNYGGGGSQSIRTERVG